VSTPTSIERALAEHALAAEESRGDADDPVQAAERVILSLRDRLVLWFGPDGFQALLGRALHRAQAQHPGLGVVRALEGDDHPLYELHESDSIAQPVSREVLTRLVGGDLVSRLVHQIWPDGAEVDRAATETRNPIRD
jgi:hypothetical protein